MGIRLGLVGIGKIARDQHAPALARSDDFDLVATASRNNGLDGVPRTASLDEMLDRFPGIEAVSLCTPPAGRAATARRALERGLHVMVEKPPATGLAEAEALAEAAARAGRSLFFSWHSRHASAVAPARTWLRERIVRAARVHWLEDVRVWHPGQDWIFEPGGFGVFDPAINALSILTEVLPRPFSLSSGVVSFPQDRQTPIAAELRFADVSGAPIEMNLDFLHPGEPRWDIEVDTGESTLRLSHGGGRMWIDEREVSLDEGSPLLEGEYPSLYRRFAELIRSGASDADVAPLRHVADAFMLAERRTAAPFQF